MNRTTFAGLYDLLDSPEATAILPISTDAATSARWWATDRKAMIDLAACGLDTARDNLPAYWYRVRRTSAPVESDVMRDHNTPDRLDQLGQNLGRFLTAWETASWEPLHDTGWAIPTGPPDERQHAALFVTGQGDGVCVRSELLARWQAAIVRPLALELIAGVPVSSMPTGQRETRRNAVRVTAPERDNYESGPPSWHTLGYIMAVRTELPRPPRVNRVHP